MPAALTADSKNEEKPTTTVAGSPTETKPEAKDSPKLKESVVSSSSSSPAAPAEPTPSTSDKSPETSTTTSEEPSSISAVDEPEASTEDVIDMEIFEQIIELDDDGSHEFAAGMVEAFFDQAEQTFKDMDDAFSKKDLGKLSALGHFLKGSSAALGVTKVQASCEDIQHYGHLRDETTGLDLSAPQALDRIQNRISQAKKDYDVAERWLKSWVKDNVPEEEED